MQSAVSGARRAGPSRATRGSPTSPTSPGSGPGAAICPPWPALASESARRTLALRGPVGDPTAEIARALGAAGYAIAHTGAARAFLFVPGTLPAGAGAVLRAAGLTGIRRFTGGER